MQANQGSTNGIEVIGFSSRIVEKKLAISVVNSLSPDRR